MERTAPSFLMHHAMLVLQMRTKCICICISFFVVSERNLTNFISLESDLCAGSNDRKNGELRRKTTKNDEKRKNANFNERRKSIRECFPIVCHLHLHAFRFSNCAMLVISISIPYSSKHPIISHHCKYADLAQCDDPSSSIYDIHHIAYHTKSIQLTWQKFSHPSIIL